MSPIRRCIIALLLVWPCSSVRAELAWEALEPLPVGVFEAAASVTGRFIVVTGGINQAGVTETAVQVFDLDRQTWSRPGALHHGRSSHAQVTLADGRVLVIGGQSGRVPGRLQPVSACEIITIEDTGQVTIERTGSLPRGIAEPTAHLMPDGRAIAIGDQAARLFDPDLGRWNQSIMLRRRRLAHASLLLDDGNVLVVAGQHERSVELVKPTDRLSIMLTAALPVALDDLQLAPLDGKRVWVLGGQGPDGVTTDRTSIIDLSDPIRSTVEDGPTLQVNGGIADHCAAVVGPWVIVAGGETQLPDGRDIELTTARLLDRRTLEVWSLPDLPIAQDDAAAVVLAEGMIVIGGYRVAGDGLLAVPHPQAVRAVSRLVLPADALR